MHQGGEDGPWWSMNSGQQKKSGGWLKPVSKGSKADGLNGSPLYLAA
jgi:hypothetical protein